MSLSTEALRAQVELRETGRTYRQQHPREFQGQDDWYDWQLASFAAGADHSAVMTLAGNQSGKTLSATYEQSVHATRDYPEWWNGARLEGDTVNWIFGVDTTQLRDVVQKLLLGPMGEAGALAGGGWVHKSEIINVVPHPNKRGLIADAWIRSIDGMNRSQLSFRTYTQTETGRGTLSFAGATVDSIYVDEQPPDSLTGQLAARRAMGRQGKGGIIRYTMTPELGMTELVRGFMEDRQPSQALIGPIAWSDCPHMTPERQAELLADIPPHEHDMRSKGKPFFGSGMVFPVGEEAIRCDPFEIPYYYRRLCAVDLGTTSPTAIAWLAWDPETDVIYLFDEYEESNPSISVHASAMKKRPTLPVVFPHDVDKTHAHSGEAGAGKTYRMMYEGEGIKTGIDFANPDGTRFVEPGISDMLDRMKSGRFKVFRSCYKWFQEFRKYHRKDGKIVKADDHLMDASRYGSQMVKYRGVEGGRRRPTRVITTRGGRQ